MRSCEITFSEITPANQNRLERNFTGTRRFRWHASSPASFCRLCQMGAKWWRKTAFSEHFVTKTTHRFTHFAAIDFREMWTQNVNRCLVIDLSWSFFRSRIVNFTNKGSFTPKTSFLWGFGGTLPVRALLPWPFGLERISASYLIVKGPGVFSRQWLFRNTCRFRDIGVQSP